MDNFRKNHAQKLNNISDGMIAGRPNKSHRIIGNSIRPATTSERATPLVRGRLDNFKSSDGFHPAQQPVINNNPSNSGRQPRRDANGVIDLTLPPAPNKPKKRRNWKRLSLRSATGLVVVVLAVGGFLFGKGYLKLHQIFKGGAQGAAALQANVDPSRLKGEGDGRINILLLGKGGAGHEAPDLTDTILIASIDPIQKKVALLSIPRDLYNPKSSNTKINAVYADAKYAAIARKFSAKDAETAGFNAIEKQVQDNMGIPIHYHLMVDFKAFEQAINTVGGVDINVDKDGTVYEVLWNPMTRKNYVLDVKQGQQHFDGQRALFYARSRHTSPRGDFDRTERQRKLMIALKEKVLSAGTLANPSKLSSLISAFGDHVQSNMTTGEVARLYDLTKNISADNIASVGLADPPNNYVITGNVGGQSIVRPTAGLTDFSQIQNFVRNALKDGFIANENATIAVYNGTSTDGLATKKATELKSFGYNVNLVGDAPTKNYQKTILVDLRGGQKKYTRHYLEQRFGVTAVTTLPDPKITNPGNSDFIVILGSN